MLLLAHREHLQVIRDEVVFGWESDLAWQSQHLFQGLSNILGLVYRLSLATLVCKALGFHNGHQVIMPESRQVVKDRVGVKLIHKIGVDKDLLDVTFV